MIRLLLLAKNEAHVIERCIRSAEGLVDSILVMDTGSTDGTQQRARELGAEVFERPWASFGENLTELHACARSSADWLLWMHADMTLDVHPDFKEWIALDPDDTVDAWMVEVRDGGISYRLPLLMRGDREWRYVGPTHEYLDTRGYRTRPVLGLAVSHHWDGSNRADKFNRDLVLLEEGYHAGDDRSTFYYAQTLRDLGRTEEAIEAYRKRGELGGFEEERWYALYQAASLSEDVEGLLEAFHVRPWRQEPLLRAAEIVARDTRGDVLFLEVSESADRIVLP